VLVEERLINYLYDQLKQEYIEEDIQRVQCQFEQPSKMVLQEGEEE
jgi:hypothetical protein